MRLDTLLQTAGFAPLPGSAEVVIRSLTTDTRTLTPGALFVAISGGTHDGHDFMPEAVARGAVAVVGERRNPRLTIPYLQVPEARRALAHLAAAWYGHPARNLIMIGVTGTDGKTTTTNLLHSICTTAGLHVGVVTSVNAVIGEHSISTGLHVTTPSSLEVQDYLAQMVAAGMTHCILEVTSHGLAQHRVEACDFDIAVLTNITHEHLDYHGSYEEYRAAKTSLFTRLTESQLKQGGPPKTAILNQDDPSTAIIAPLTTARVLSYGLGAGADVVASDISSSERGLDFKIEGLGYTAQVHSPLIGLYNIANCTAAYAAAVGGLGLKVTDAVRGIGALAGVMGRMEVIDLGQPFTAIVDFAHTPNALRRALEAVRELTAGRVIAVFGSAGLRDREKRRLMAETSIRLADRTVLTAEDPRSESLDGILAEMALGAQAVGGSEGETYWRVPDRGEALRFATRMAQPGDLLIACGKGHEQSMCFGDIEYPWDDRVAMRAAIAEGLGLEGPSMPHLPTSSRA